MLSCGMCEQLKNYKRPNAFYSRIHRSDSFFISEPCPSPVLQIHVKHPLFTAWGPCSHVYLASLIHSWFLWPWPWDYVIAKCKGHDKEKFLADIQYFVGKSLFFSAADPLQFFQSHYNSCLPSVWSACTPWQEKDEHLYHKL